ncbi:MAG TPA: hypothetical protein VJU78_07175 [Chitinophagaceae bacterium]|nr:hypothetical protein [Chitinophagaceae bacterium]
MKETKLMRFIAMAVISVCSIATTFAQNIHFIGSPAITDNGSTLSFCGKLAGLGNSEVVTVTLNTTATTITECTNAGGNVAPGQTKTGTVSTSGTFTADKNGSVTFCLTTNTPSPGKCPNGKWTGTVTDVSFSNSFVSVNGTRVN